MSYYHIHNLCASEDKSSLFFGKANAAAASGWRWSWPIPPLYRLSPLGRQVILPSQGKCQNDNLLTDLGALWWNLVPESPPANYCDWLVAYGIGFLEVQFACRVFPSLDTHQARHLPHSLTPGGITFWGRSDERTRNWIASSWIYEIKYGDRHYYCWVL